MKSPGLTAQIFIGLLIGIVIGWVNPVLGTNLAPGSEIFLRLIKTIIAPLIFSTLVVGIAGKNGHGNSSLGKLSLKCLLYFEAVTTMALAVGLLVVNIMQPGKGVNLAAANVADAAQFVGKQPGPAEFVTHIVPTSIIDAMARGDVLQIVVFTILFAIAVKATNADKVTDMCQSLAEVMFKYTGYVMKIAPIGVACAIAATIGKHGVLVLLSLGKLVGCLYLSLVLFILCVLVPIALVAQIPFKTFFKAVREPALIAFSTTSSEAALPKALLAMERIGVPRGLVSFVLPLGYSFNLDGTTLYLSVASIFVAQAAGVHLSLQQQILMMLTLMLTSKGVAAVPRASLVILAATLSSFNLPLSGVALILGVDTLMDMARTSVNVIGNCLASVVLARWEGVLGIAAGDQPESVINADPHAATIEAYERAFAASHSLTDSETSVHGHL